MLILEKTPPQPQDIPQFEKNWNTTGQQHMLQQTQNFFLPKKGPVGPFMPETIMGQKPMSPWAEWKEGPAGPFMSSSSLTGGGSVGTQCSGHGALHAASAPPDRGRPHGHGHEKGPGGRKWRVRRRRNDSEDSAYRMIMFQIIEIKRRGKYWF